MPPLLLVGGTSSHHCPRYLLVGDRVLDRLRLASGWGGHERSRCRGERWQSRDPDRRWTRRRGIAALGGVARNIEGTDEVFSVAAVLDEDRAPRPAPPPPPALASPTVLPLPPPNAAGGACGTADGAAAAAAAAAAEAASSGLLTATTAAAAEAAGLSLVLTPVGEPLPLATGPAGTAAAVRIGAAARRATTTTAAAWSVVALR